MSSAKVDQIKHLVRVKAFELVTKEMIKKRSERDLGSTLLVDSRKFLENNLKKDRGFTIRSRLSKMFKLIENSKI